MDIKDISALVISSYKEILSELNLKNTPDEETIDSSSVLIGQQSILDSLSLVRLIINTEQKLSEEYGITVTIADERAMSQKHSPFRTIGTLAHYISTLVEENRSVGK
jgi:acyl carrier protein